MCTHTHTLSKVLLTICITACGRSSTVKKVDSTSGLRVVGGINALEGEWPWQVSLHFSGYLYCGASVLSSDWLISAAHCFSRDRLSDPRQWSAHLGMLYQGSARHVAEIQRIVVHEYYNRLTFDYDIALLQLRSPWPPSLSFLIQPVCLPATSQTLTHAHRCWVTGWGYRSEEGERQNHGYTEFEVSVLDQSECKRRYGPVSPRMLCAGVPSGQRDACRGDSGGPLSCWAPGSEGRWFLTGIVSWGAGCGRPNLPGVYTRVNKFTTWIQNHILDAALVPFSQSTLTTNIQCKKIDMCLVDPNVALDLAESHTPNKPSLLKIA
uniref:Transmembrane serine protease 7 n=1 Tax=Oncorhynchus mykiss TaxID=8022 RepID=A0A8K9WLK4_ONCMY